MLRFSLFSARLISRQLPSSAHLPKRSFRLDLFSEQVSPIEELKKAALGNNPKQLRIILEKFPKELDLTACDKVLKLLPKNPQSKDNYCEQASRKISDYQKQ